MKERLAEDWLSRINERGYQTAFAQVLSASGHTLLRLGHSPYEHGRDIVSLSPAGEVCAFQLKGGNIGLKEWEKGFPQVCALVETLPRHPSLPEKFLYQPYLVTNGVFSDPAADRVDHHNVTWRQRGFTTLGIRDGRWLHRELLKLYGDFWPTAAPDVRKFRKLYLVDGRGDFAADDFAAFIQSTLAGDCSGIELARRSAAANILASYVLSEFYVNEDHWSVFRGWTMTAAAISAAAERLAANAEAIDASFELARNAAEDALGLLSQNCCEPDAFKPRDLEWDEYTRIRNTVAIGAWAGHCLLNRDNTQSARLCLERVDRFLADDRLSIWSEGAFPFFCTIAWLLDRHSRLESSVDCFMRWLVVLVTAQHQDSENPLADPFASPDEVVKQLADSVLQPGRKIKTVVLSYVLFPLILMLVRRGASDILKQAWRKLSRIRMTIFEYDVPAGYLEWRCARGTERDFEFAQPQPYSDLLELAGSPPVYKLPARLQSDARFRLMFFLVFPHRVAWSIIGSLDEEFSLHYRKTNPGKEPTS